LKLLVLDGYAPDGRKMLRDAGGTDPGPLYAQLLERLADGVQIDIVHPGDPNPDLPRGPELEAYDGAVWTGSSLTILRDEDSRVSRQIELAGEILDRGVPSFGSCWAAQLAAVACGGRCAANPRGREFGISRQITLSSEGRTHPMYAEKPPVFDAFTSHADEICQLPEGSAPLASNAFSPVQAIDVTRGRGRFWAVQYHPEYDAGEVAALCRLRAEELLAQGVFSDRSSVDRFASGLEILHRDPSAPDLAADLGLGDDLLNEQIRTREVAAWLAHEAAPRAALR
jgi:GMP synthase (glutamine-hydrolysing)